jgi:hypothetical protein
LPLVEGGYKSPCSSKRRHPVVCHVVADSPGGFAQDTSAALTPGVCEGRERTSAENEPTDAGAVPEGNIVSERRRLVYAWHPKSAGLVRPDPQGGRHPHRRRRPYGMNRRDVGNIPFSRARKTQPLPAGTGNRGRRLCASWYAPLDMRFMVCVTAVPTRTGGRSISFDGSERSRGRGYPFADNSHPESYRPQRLRGLPSRQSVELALVPAQPVVRDSCAVSCPF